MKLEDLEAKLGIANMGEEEKLALVKDIQANIPALKAEQRVLEAKTQANLVVEAIKKIKEGLEARFDELNGIVDVKVRDITSGKDGLQGPKGDQGDRGFDGVNGKDGYNGKDGIDGVDGKDGVGVQDAYIDFDGSLIIKLTDGKELNVGEVVPMDVAEKIKVIGNGGGTSQSVLDSLTSLQDQINTLTGIDGTLGTMAQQDANAVAITGGTINGATIGATTPAAGTFTTLTGGGGSANYFQTQGSATTKAVEVKALGSDTNIAFVIDSKGTGAIDLAAGSSGVNISNGGTVTALTRTTAGSGYTSKPTMTISAPTTAGGVQATGDFPMAVSTVAVGAGGTGYTVGDVLTLSGGTYTSQATVTVATVSAGVITSITLTTAGVYTVLPSNPATVTGGTGSGATVSQTWLVSAGVAFTITNAGSGYVEQPTVTFSGGGGSGAAAYATVGSGAIIRSIGVSSAVVTNQAFTFQTPNSITSGNPVFIIRDSASHDSWYQMGPSSSQAFLVAKGNANASAYLGASGSGSVRFTTNGDSITEQMRVAHTASAVNYVQVTGAATGSAPSITSQGSDANIGLSFSTKGAFNTSFRSGNGSWIQFVINGANNSVNYLSVAGNTAGSAPSMSAVGSDTNIPLVLQPKGTGALQAQQTDSTATGGNARGANAVDWQTSRNAAAQVASGQFSVVSGGFGNRSSGYGGCVGGGEQNLSSGYDSVAVAGASNQAQAGYSFVGGGLNNLVTQGYAASVGGYFNTASGFNNFIGGGERNSGTSSAVVTTQAATTVTSGSTAVTLSGSNAAIKVGQLIQGTGITVYPNQTYVAAISGTSLTLSQVASGSGSSTLTFFTPHGVVVGGGNNQATGSYSFIGGGGDAGTAANRNVASGDWSFVGGGIKNTSSGSASVVVGGGSFGSGFAANTASGTSSFIGSGYLNNASGFASVIGGGSGNTTNNNSAFVGGGNANIANSDSGSIAGGQYGTTRSINGNAVFPAHINPIAQSAGVSQAALLILGVETTNATATVLRSSTAAAGTTNQVILPNNSAYYFRGTVVAGVTGGGNTKGWTIEGVIKRGANAGTTAIVGTATVMSSYADVGAATWALTATADTTNGGLAITFTGQAATTIRCVAKVETVEMTF